MATLKPLKITVITGGFTLVAALCGGLFLVANTMLEHWLSTIPTPTYASGSPTQIAFTDDPMARPRPVPSVTPFPVGQVWLDVNFITDKAVAVSGDIVSYSFYLENETFEAIDPLFLFGNLSPHLEYIPGSTFASQTGMATLQVSDEWWANGVNLGELPVGHWVLLEFRARVNDDLSDAELIESVIQIKKTWLGPNENEWFQCAAKLRVGSQRED